MDELILRSRRATTRAWVIYVFIWTLVLCAGTYIGWRYDHTYTGLFVGAGVLIVALGYALLLSPWHLMMHLPKSQADYSQAIAYVQRLIQPICVKANVEVPRIFVIPVDVCNACAAGVFGRTRAVGVTVGALQLTEPELTAILAHEVAHIKRRDNLFTGFWLALIGLTMTAAIVLFVIGLGLASSSNGRRRRKDDGGAGMIGAFAMALAVVGGIVAIVLMHVAMRSDMRRREYLADYDAAVWTGHPEAMISALETMEQRNTALFPRQTAAAFAFSMRAVPKRGIVGWLFDTHPSTTRRIKRLRALEAAMGDGKQ